MAGQGPGMPMQMGGQMAGQIPGQMQGQMAQQMPSQMGGMHMQQGQPNMQQVQSGQMKMMNMPLGPGGQPQTAPQPAQHPVQADHRPVDPVARFKALVPRLKESLVNLFRVGAHLFYQNARQDETGTQVDNNSSGNFEKSLEEFYAICDQIEISLRLASEIIQQDRDSQRNTPKSGLDQKGESAQLEGQAYTQYLATIRAQIGCGKEIRDLLHDCLKHFPEHPHS